MGNAEEMRKLADLLDQESDNIAGIYAEKTGKPVSEIRGLMKDTLWMTGSEAKDLGFADEITDFEALNCTFDLSCFRRVPEEITNNSARGAQPQPKPQMRPKLIALLNKHGIKFADSATDDELFALVETIPPVAVLEHGTEPDPAITNLQNEIKTIKAERDKERKARMEREIAECPGVPVNERAGWLEPCMKDETLLAKLKAIPAPIAADPLNYVPIENLGDDPKNIAKAVLNEWGKSLDQEEAKARGRRRAAIITDNFKKLWSFITNAGVNTVHADLKRTVILQQMIRAFAVRVLPLNSFSTLFQGIRLEGTNKVVIPYFPLSTAASTDFVTANGYDTFGDTNSDAKTITVKK